MKCIKCNEELTVHNRKEVRAANRDYLDGVVTEPERQGILDRAHLEVKVCFVSDNGKHVAR